MIARVFFSIRALLLPALLLSLGTAQAQTLERNGTATYVELGSDLYLGTLFVEAPSQSVDELLSEEQAKRMEIRFSDDMSRRRWTQYWTQSIAINSPRENLVAAGEEMSRTLSAFESDMKYGDKVELIYHPAEGTSLVVNGTELTSDKSALLFNLFLSAWVGPVPPSSDFKSAILGKQDSGEAFTRFRNLQPSEERIAAVASWVAEEQEEQVEEETDSQEAEVAATDDGAGAPADESEAGGDTETEEQRQAREEAERQARLEEERRRAEQEAREQARAEQLSALQIEGVSKREESEEQIDLSVEAILAQQDYTTNIIAKIYQSVSYPRAAINRNWEGSVRASITVLRDGTVEGVQLVEECDHAILNTAVKEAIENASPFPPIPDAVQAGSLEMMVPVAFKLQ